MQTLLSSVLTVLLFIQHANQFHAVEYGIRRDAKGFWPVVLHNDKPVFEPKKTAFSGAAAAMKAAKVRAESIEFMVLHGHLDSVNNQYIETGARGVDWDCTLSPLAYSIIPAAPVVNTLLRAGSSEWFESRGVKVETKPAPKKRAAKVATPKVEVAPVEAPQVAPVTPVEVEAPKVEAPAPVEVAPAVSEPAEILPKEEPKAMQKPVYRFNHAAGKVELVTSETETTLAPVAAAPEVAPEVETDSYDFADPALFMLKQAAENGIIPARKVEKMLAYYTAIFEGNDPQHVKHAGNVPAVLELLQRSLQAKARR